MPNVNYISEVSIGENTYAVKDEEARQLISSIGSFAGFLGVSSTTLTDGSTTQTITINGDSIEAPTGGIATYGSKEFIWNGSAWQEFGDMNAIGELGFADSATASYTPAGTISGTTVSASNAQTTTVNSITDVGTLPTFTVTNETLVITPGTLPTMGSNTTVVTDIGNLVVTDPTFSGTAATITVSVPSEP